MKILAVSGGSGCGKTLFTKLLVKRLPKSAVLPLDSYYKTDLIIFHLKNMILTFLKLSILTCIKSIWVV